MKFTAYKLTLTYFYDGGCSKATAKKVIAKKPSLEEIKDFITEEIALFPEIAEDSYMNDDYICGMHLDIDEREFEFPEFPEGEEAI